MRTVNSNEFKGETQLCQEKDTGIIENCISGLDFMYCLSV